MQLLLVVSLDLVEVVEDQGVVGLVQLLVCLLDGYVHEVTGEQIRVGVLSLVEIFDIVDQSAFYSFRKKS